jgi:hypothetical protein
MLDMIVSDILDSDNLPVVFYVLDRVRTAKLSDPVNQFRG